MGSSTAGTAILPDEIYGSTPLDAHFPFLSAFANGSIFIPSLDIGSRLQSDCLRNRRQITTARCGKNRVQLVPGRNIHSQSGNLDNDKP
jgi:hypothetical protein